MFSASPAQLAYRTKLAGDLVRNPLWQWTNTATRLWIAIDTSKPGSGIGRIPGLAFLQQQLHEVDTQWGSIRVRSVDMGGA